MMGRVVTERRINPLAAFLAVFAMSMPASAEAQAQSILVGDCMGGATRINIPGKAPAPDPDDCCKKGCHAAGDRRKKNQDDDDSCC